MEKSKVCLCLDGKTIAEDLKMVNQYRNYIDLVELRADCLNDEEMQSIRRFPELVGGLPCILTIRRKSDGGQFVDGEAARTVIFASSLAYSEKNSGHPFAYIDMESDYFISTLNDAAFAFGTKIIRSYHNFSEPVTDLKALMKNLRKTGFEIPKVAFMPNSLEDVTRLYKQSNAITDFDHIVLAMGPIGQPSRILATKFNSFLTYTCSEQPGTNLSELGQIDPVTLRNLYHFDEIDGETSIYGVAGYPLKVTGSPALHNAGFKKHGINSVYVPVRSKNAAELIDFAETLNIKALSVTVPLKNEVVNHLEYKDKVVEKIRASNTIVRTGLAWTGYNTDVHGFKKSLLEFLGTKSLFGKKVSIIGAGGAAKAIAYVVKELHGKACVFNRTVEKARLLAEEFGFKYSSLGFESMKLISKYSDIIIQTTSVGLGVEENTISTEKNDPLYFYPFSGKEKVYDVIYEPVKTPILLRAEKSGCKVCNGEDMLRYQGYEQFEIYTGEKY
ncbi:MAG: type I 3-dehydroquinate dehydratase [Treponemataceae bacterium]|nr:type I 3-dehydroquinate dehydratase [Spirochaetales bacterium]MDY6030430.1 type I 3-dehydroquinate dehydratase [Treponemataceae bacterium]